MAGDAVQFYRLSGGSSPDPAVGGLRLRQPRHHARFWRPSLAAPFPPGRFDPKLASYTAMQALGMFEAPGYGAVLIEREDGTIDHRAMLMPRFTRFPFMAPDDLQIGATFTTPEARGQGLALRAIHEVVEHFARLGRTFWYLTDETNLASVAVIRKAGFELAGTGGKRARCGLRFLGFYDMVPPDRGRGA